jgi:hypothetical protein
MAMTKPYEDPDTGAEFPRAYIRIDRLTVDFRAGMAQVGLAVHATPESAGAGRGPVDRINLNSGVLDVGPDGAPAVSRDGGPVGLPDLATILADNAEHFDAIRTYLYRKAAELPRFAGASDA